MSTEPEAATAASGLRVIDTNRMTINPARLVEALRDGHRRGKSRLGRSHLEETSPDGTASSLLVWPAWQPGAALGAKLVTVFPEKPAAGRAPSIRSVYMLFDAIGEPLALFTGEAFTRHKTAADSALGASFLARPKATRLLVLGAGSQAELHILYMLQTICTIREVQIWHRSPIKAHHLAASLCKRGVEATPAPDRASATEAADIVCCLTASSSPVLQGAWLQPGTHVDLVGGFTPSMRECDDTALKRARLFADHRELVLGHNGDFRDPMQRGVIAAADVVGDLYDLCAGDCRGRTADDEITVFKNGGGGHLDLMTAMALYAWSR